MRLDDNEIFERLLNNQALIRLPLVRNGNDVSVGSDKKAWTSWLAESRSGAAG